MTSQSPEILIRECRGFAEFDACVRLQTDVWGYDVSDTIPLREFVVIQRIGGQVIGAFDRTKSEHTVGDAAGMIGFAMAMPGIRSGQAYLHSHMLAVLPEYRNAGIGRRLKLAQRDDALARGIAKMEWTFDPLEIKNAHLNIARLGAIVRSYTPNFYGVFSSRLQAGLPTDRLHAEWWMDSARVKAALNSSSASLPETLETIVVPGAVREWKLDPSSFAKAAAVQTEIRVRFQEAFARGLTVVGFSNTETRDKWNRFESVTGERERDGMYYLANWCEP